MSSFSGLENDIYNLVSSELARRGLYTGKIKCVPVGVTARHVHVTKEHFEELFGKGVQMTVYVPISQPGQFACNEKLTIVGSKGVIEDVRILGPFRKQTQIEASLSDTRRLGVDAPIRESGKLAGSAGVTLIGPRGQVDLHEGLILMERHIHMIPAQAQACGYHNGQIVKIRAEGPKGGILDNVAIRVREDFALDLHIDTDDANSLGLSNGNLVEIIESEQTQCC